MKKRMFKALRDLNAYIDDDREKLCDRIHRLEVSHKRMRKLLKIIEENLESSDFLYDLVVNELNRQVL